MKKILAFISTLLFIQTLTYSQYALIKINLSDCIKCKIMFEKQIENYTIKTPIFFVFPSYEEDEKKKVNAKLGELTKVFKVIYDDDMYKLASKNTHSGIYYVNSKGIKSYFKDFLDIDNSTLKTIDSIYENDYVLKTKIGANYYISDTTIYEHNSQADIIYKINNSGTRHKFFELDENIMNVLDATLKRSSPHIAKLNELNKKNHISIRDDNKPKIDRVITKDDLLLVSVSYPMLYTLEPDVSKYEEMLKRQDSSIVIPNVEFKIIFKNGALVAAYELDVMEDINIPKQILSSNFIPISQNEFIYIYGELKLPEAASKLFSKFVVKGDKIVYDKTYNIKYPKKYVENNYYNNLLGLGFSAANYPYYFPYYNDSYIDFEKSEYFDVANFTNNFNMKFDSERGRCSFRNGYLFKRANNYYLISYDEFIGFRFFVMDLVSNKLVHEFSEKDLWFDMKQEGSIRILYNKKQELLYLEDKDEKLRAFPIKMLEFM